MDGNPPPDGRGTAEQRSSAPPGAAGDAVESFGPLALRRMGKDDGRSLIVYERGDPAPQDASGDPGPGRTRA